MVRVEVGQKVVLALGALKVEPVHHEIGAVDPLDVLNLLRHVSCSTEDAAEAGQLTDTVLALTQCRSCYGLAVNVRQGVA